MHDPHSPHWKADRVNLQTVQFETPENVQIGYRVAGPGTRFLAWLIDELFVLIVSIILIMSLMIVGIFASTVEQQFEQMVEDPEHGPQAIMYAMGFCMLIWTFSGVTYFSLAELFMRGQSLGKRVIGLRVVKQNGFSIDAQSILVRNLFRLFESLPMFWITPVLSQQTQRLGDMVAGTLVVIDRVEPMQRVRREMARRTDEECRYRFNIAQLARLRPIDIELLERLLDRWDSIPRGQLVELVHPTIEMLSTRLQVDRPAREDRLRFLEDLLASLYRSRERTIL